MSQPCLSNPNGCPLRGPSELFDRLQSRGSPWPNQLANACGTIATTIISRMNPPDNQKVGRRESCAMASRNSEACRASVGSLASIAVTCASTKADPRVENAVEQVDEQIEQQEDEDQ